MQLLRPRDLWVLTLFQGSHTSGGAGRWNDGKRDQMKSSVGEKPPESAGPE